MPNPAHHIALIIPALDEAESIGRQLEEIPLGLAAQTIVVDNGSSDRTPELAREAGAEVVSEPRRGYGRACLAGLDHLRPDVTAILFLDADLSHAPQDIEKLAAVFCKGGWDMVVGSRVLGRAEPGALTPVQRFGNWLTTRLIRWIWGASFTDLGPLRILTREALRRLEMQDPDFGWNVEMQVKAARLGLKFTEVPVTYRRRRYGRSKISGTISGSARAGAKILWTVYKSWHDSPRSVRASNPTGIK